MHCRSCKQYIRDGAKKCQKCGVFQNWRRWFDSSNFFLAFLVSIFALFPVIQKAWKGDYIEIRASIVKSDTRGLSLLISNKGNLDGGVRRAYIEVYGLDKLIFTAFLDTTEWEKLEAKKSHLIQAKSLDGQIPIYADPFHNEDAAVGECKLHIEYVSAVLNSDKEEVEYPCYLASFSDKADLR